MERQKQFESQKAQQELAKIRGYEVESVYIGYIKNGKAVQQDYQANLEDFISTITLFYTVKTDKKETCIYGKYKYFLNNRLF